jgi:hypothetical protein
MSSSRKAIRQQFALLLQANVTAAQVIYDHQPGDFGGQSPAICVGSAGSERTRMSFRGSRLTCYLDVDVFVLTADGTSVYTQADAENALDDVEAQLAACLDDVQQAAGWEAIDYAGRSQTDFLIVDGKEYKRERIPIQIQIFS